MRKPQNYLSMAGFVEEFLHNCLHGDLEPYTLGQYKSSAIVRNSFNVYNPIGGLDNCGLSESHNEHKNTKASTVFGFERIHSSALSLQATLTPLCY